MRVFPGFICPNESCKKCIINHLVMACFVSKQKVHAMVAPVENLPFDAFDKSHAALWQAVVYQFDQDKGKIEDLTKAFIDTSFKKLRSAEGGSRDWMAHHIFFSTPAQKHKNLYLYICICICPS